ncbi:LOW QUALITY PROTEIN: E3 ubiquitin-protein ligase UHRF1 [Acyrthosiphon pisum]|uniref:RING-type E3 ubiquitin transferase n=1 Tax=Acyrthosiphon pisum TaxID=7029 RepID=A0A8R1W1E5_ACYPI|nr:LOW QUALITY PROTEIN: E3 ubiquitin-protein ligase UHRF1 [Acyrthosiphon pisum]
MPVPEETSVETIEEEPTYILSKNLKKKKSIRSSTSDTNNTDNTNNTNNTDTKNTVVKQDNLDDISEESKYFKLGDYVDIRDFEYGVWYMGKIVKIKKDDSSQIEPTSSSDNLEDDGLIYFVEDIGCPTNPPTKAKLKEIRPYSTDILPFDQLKINDKVLMNYNQDYPKERGYWFDVVVKQIIVNRRIREVVGNVTIGSNKAVLDNCNLKFVDDIFKIKPYKLVAERSKDEDTIMQTKPSTERATALSCIRCKDNKSKPCKYCACHICGGKEDEDKQVLCDECDDSFHIGCLTPPLTEVPDVDYWYCPTCKVDDNEIVKAGGKLKDSKKKTLASTSTRDWGKGMACVGRTKKCNIVPPNHFGPIPGVEVGTTWLFRVQVSESGIHRPPVGGIHGRDNQGAFSIVLSGGYEDDIDNGEEFMYTGSGGRDLSGNKRTALQSCDQELTRNNRALALNCNADINDKEGATAVDWKKGKPVRVVRNYKLRKHSEYAPEVGNRYDGLYKVTKYYPETGISGFVVWRFVLKRDDPIPAPWTAKGKKRIVQLGLEMIYPENYLPSTELDNEESDVPGSKEKEHYKTTLMMNQMKIYKKKDEKKAKMHYKLENEAETLIAADAANKKYWDDCKALLKDGKKAFLDRIEETFMCICCQDIVFEPITLECAHNICKGCLKRSFRSEVYQCPACRAELGKTYSMKINITLANTLLYFFPGYNAGR